MHMKKMLALVIFILSWLLNQPLIAQQKAVYKIPHTFHNESHLHVQIAGQEASLRQENYRFSVKAL